MTRYRRDILLAMAGGGLTDEELVDKVEGPPGSIRTERVEMSRAGILVTAGVRRVRSGNLATVHKLAERSPSPLPWRCTVCDTRPGSAPEVSFDPSWAVGRCDVCGPAAVFRLPHA